MRHRVRPAVLAALPALLALSACTTGPSRPVLPGLVIGPQGEIVAANAATVRATREREVERACAGLLSGGLPRVDIGSDPVSFDRRDWFWETVVVEVTFPGQAGDALPPYLEVTRRIQDTMRPWMRGGALPDIRFPGPAIAPAQPASGTP